MDSKTYPSSPQQHELEARARDATASHITKVCIELVENEENEERARKDSARSSRAL